MALNEHTNELVPPTMFDRATFRLHPSFGARANQTIKQPPFRISEEGWGEFDMQIVLTPHGTKGGSADHTLDHDLNFQQEQYVADHKITFRNPKPELLTLLAQTGSVPGQEAANGGKDAAGSARKKGRKDKNVDMEKLAEGLQGLGEDDLLQVVQMVHDGKTSDTYTKNDVESACPLPARGRRVANPAADGEFHVDLYTLPDQLIKSLWDFCAEKTDMSRV